MMLLERNPRVFETTTSAHEKHGIDSTIEGRAAPYDG